MKFVDLFCGIGTIRMGMEQAGHECVYSVEWDKHKRRIYGIIFGSEPEGQDIRRVQATDVPQSDCWCFGAPCQDFSIAGKREGLEGDRSSLVREVFRLIRETKEEYRPKYLLYENVKGMLSSNKGFDYLEILAEMDSLGFDVEWQLLNSKYWIPHNRERVYTLGHLRGRSGGKVFPIRESNEVYNQPGKIKKGIYEDTRDIALTLTAKGQSNWTGSFVKQIGNCMATGKRDNPNQGRVYDTNGISPTLSKTEGGGRQPHIVVQAVLTPNREEKRQNGRRMKEPGEPMFTLTKQDIHGVMISEATKQGYAVAQEGDSINLAVPGSQTRRGRVGKGIANTLDTSCNQGTLIQNRIRRLTPKECWRLQGIKDEITDRVIAAGISDTQMYRGAGDACTVNVIYEIAKRL